MIEKLDLDQQIKNAKAAQQDNFIHTVYHGSSMVVRNPEYSKCRPKNDFGRGFYCTPDENLAKEWAAAADFGKSGYANQYSLNLKGLKVVNFHSREYTLLNWLAILLKNRDFQPSTYAGKENREYILHHFFPDIDDTDVIIGYRADDSYFSWAKDFINNIITFEQLAKAMHLGQLGDQIVLVSPKSFEHIEFVSSIEVTQSWYYTQRLAKEKRANLEYDKLKMTKADKFDLTASDIREGGLINDDFRVSENIHR